MNTAQLEQGQSLKAVATPDYNAEGALPFVVGEHGCASITVSQLRGPMGFYDCAHITFENGLAPQMIPLHQCDFIQL